MDGDEFSSSSDGVPLQAYMNLLAMATSAAAAQQASAIQRADSADDGGDSPPTSRQRADVAQISSEDQQWLKAALADAMLSDPVKQLKAILERLKELLPKVAPTTTTKLGGHGDEIKVGGDEDNGVAQVMKTMDDLTDLICDMDLALDYCKLGGLELLRKYLVSERSRQQHVFRTNAHCNFVSTIEIENRN